MTLENVVGSRFATCLAAEIDFGVSLQLRREFLEILKSTPGHEIDFGDYDVLQCLNVIGSLDGQYRYIPDESSRKKIEHRFKEVHESIRAYSHLSKTVCAARVDGLFKAVGTYRNGR